MSRAALMSDDQFGRPLWRLRVEAALMSHKQLACRLQPSLLGFDSRWMPNFAEKDCVQFVGFDESIESGALRVQYSYDLPQSWVRIPGGAAFCGGCGIAEVE